MLALQIDSGGAIQASVWMTCQGHEIGSTKVDLHSGNNAVDVEAQIAESGVNLMEVHISSAGAEQVLFSQAVSVRRPRVLYVRGGHDASAPLLAPLKRAQVDVETAAAFPVNHGGRDWDAGLFDNYPDHALSRDEDAAVEKYVYAGGGLIFVAGDSNAKL